MPEGVSIGCGGAQCEFDTIDDESTTVDRARNEIVVVPGTRTSDERPTIIWITRTVPAIESYGTQRRHDMVRVRQQDLGLMSAYVPLFQKEQ